VRLLVTQGRPRLDADPILVDHRFNTEAEAFKLLRSIVVRFGNVAARSGARPVLLILPGKDDLAGYRESRSRKYAPLLAVLDDARLPYIDLMTALAPHDLDALFAGHYTPFGNRVVATHLRDALLARGLIPPRAPSRSAGDP
jgi:hypothetical protein